jgi:hypothetical protein
MGFRRCLESWSVHDEPTTLWTVRRENEEVACQVRLVPYGIEVDIAHSGTVVLTRVFETDDEALAWASVKRAAREAQGWIPVQPDTPHGHGRPA